MTSSMINVATTGVIDHTEPHISSFEARPSTLIDKAAPTARKSTRTEKMAPLLVPVSFVNILQTSLCCARGWDSYAETSARFPKVLAPFRPERVAQRQPDKA